MGLIPTRKKDEELEDTLKILSTNIEVINQKLAASSSEFSIENFQQMVEKDMAWISKQLKFLTDYNKSSQATLQQQMSEGFAQSQILAKLIKQGETNLKDHISTEKMDLQTKFLLSLDSIFKEVKNSNTALADSLKETEKLNNEISQRIGSLKFDESQVTQIINATSTQVTKKIGVFKSEIQNQLASLNNTISKSIQKGNKLPDNFVEDMNKFKEEFIQKLAGFDQTIMKNIQKGSTISDNFVQDLGYIKKNLQPKLVDITDIMLQLVKINNELLSSMKKNKLAISQVPVKTSVGESKKRRIGSKSI